MFHSNIDPIATNPNLRHAFVALRLKDLQDPLFELTFAFTMRGLYDRDPIARELQVMLQNLNAPVFTLLLNLLRNH